MVLSNRILRSFLYHRILRTFLYHRILQVFLYHRILRTFLYHRILRIILYDRILQDCRLLVVFLLSFNLLRQGKIRVWIYCLGSTAQHEPAGTSQLRR